MRNHQSLIHKQAGFTLIELIIVIVIIGILAAVAIPRFANVTDQATFASRNATLGAVRSAWSVAFAVAHVAPTVAQIGAQMTSPTGCATGTCSDGTLIDFGANDPVASPMDITCTNCS